MGLSVGLCAQYELAAAVTDGCVLVTVGVTEPPSLTLSLFSLYLSLFLPKPCPCLSSGVASNIPEETL